MITSQQVRILLDRNRNGLDARPLVRSGTSMPPGLYWDTARRQVLSAASSQTADRDYVLLSSDPQISFDELVRQVAMGGGGHSGRSIPYHAGAASEGHH